MYIYNTTDRLLDELGAYFEHGCYIKLVTDNLLTPLKHIEGLELKRTISTFFKKWAKCTFLVLSNHTLRVRNHGILYLVKDA